MLEKKLSPALTLFLIILSCLITFCLDTYFRQRISAKAKESISLIETTSNHYKSGRLEGYRLIKPLVYTQKNEESALYSDIKNSLNTYIEQLKREQKLISASVYLRDFDQGDWMCINNDETYYPGSLIKVPGMITFLKMAEKNPSLLNKKFVFNPANKNIPNQTFNSNQIVAGKSYSIKQLLKYMIAYSDNNATYLLNSNADMKVFNQLFTDLNIPLFTKKNATITAKNFSSFLNILFDASYLSKENSEFAVELLEACDFKLGMVKGLPASTIVAHKFGEMGDSTMRQLHESGLIYIHNTPYLLTVMTNGYDVTELPDIIGNISRMVYQNFINKANQ